MPDFNRLTTLLDIHGVQVSKPVDRLDPGKASFLSNARSYQAGSVECRSGMAALNGSALDQTNIHSIRRLNDSLPSAANYFIRVVGAGTKLYAGAVPVAPALIVGFSGNPLSLINYQPPSSPEAWMYVGDSLKMAKLKSDAATTANMGGAPPLSPPVTALAQPLSVLVNDFSSATGWSGTATGGTTISTLTEASRLSGATTIAANGIVYDSGNTGWCSIAPTIVDSNIGAGMLLTINTGGGSAEEVVVEAVMPSSVQTSSTIAAITYDTGTTGLCTVQVSVPNPQLMRNSMVRFTGGTAETVRVLSVTTGKDGLSSFRCVTANTHAAGQGLSGFTSIRCYTVNNHAAGETLTATCLTATITPTTGNPISGTAFITLNINLNLLSFAAAGRPVQGTDVIHVSIQMGNPSALTQGQVAFDVDASTNNFTQNFLWKAFRQADLQSVVSGSSTVPISQQAGATYTALQNFLSQVQNGTIKNVNVISGGPLLVNTLNGLLDTETMQIIGPNVSFLPPATLNTGTTQTISDQSISGSAQWTELDFQVSELTRAGGDFSRGLNNVAAIQITFIVQGVTSIGLSSWYVRGGYGPYVTAAALPLQYQYRGWASATGARSNPSPATRSGEMPQSERVIVNMTQHPDSQYDMLEIQRFGGTNLAWKTVGSTQNSANPSFNDDYTDVAIQGAEAFETDNDQPFPQIDVKKSGVCSVAGTAVTWISGDAFDIQWAPDTIININGIDYTMYSNPKSNSFLETNENVGALSNVPFVIEEPIIAGQPLQCLWGPHPTIDVIFGCGSPYQPGTLFWTKQSNADAAPQAYQQEVCPASEILQNGVMLPDGRSFVWSTQRYFAIYPSLNDLGDMTIMEAGKRGLFSPWLLCAGEGKIWFADTDGIYESDDGNGEVSITDNDLYPIFPHDGKPGEGANGYAAVNLTGSRLSYQNGWVLFDYQDSNGIYQRLSYRVRDKSWWPDTYPQSSAPIMAYEEEGEGLNSVLFGGRDGFIYVDNGLTSDNGTPITWEVRTKSDDYNDPVPNKEWGDVLLDLNTGNANVQVTAGFDNYATLLAPVNIATAARPTQNFPSISFGDMVGQFGRNLAIDFLTVGAGPVLYSYFPSATIVPEFLTEWLFEATTHGLSGFQHLGPTAFFSLISTTDVTLTVIVDGNIFTYKISSTGGVQTKQQVQLAVMKGLLYAYRFTSSAAFRVFKGESAIQVKPWGSTAPYQWINPFGQDSRGRSLS